MQNKFAALDFSDKLPDEMWTEMKIIRKNAEESRILKIETKKKSAWLTDAAIDIATQRRELKRKKSTKAEYNQLNNAFQRQARKDKEAYTSKICDEIERDSNAGKTRDLFKKIRDITGKFNPKLGGLKNKSGEDITSQDEVKARWKEYTEALYMKEPTLSSKHDEIAYPQEPAILTSEVQKAIREIKKGKSPGSDDIPIELLSATGEEGLRLMTRLCQEIWDTGDWPQDWKKSVYIPIPKKGDSRVCSNNRTIALISHASKILLKIIQGRLEEHVRREIPDVQAGFSKGRGTRDHIANLRWIMERQREYHQDLYMCFIDYNKAFDCVDHALMWNTLRRMGFPEHITHLLDRLYKGQTAVVRTEFGDTEPFPIGKGVRQGCILSPMLFNLYAEEIMRDAGLQESQSGVRIGGRVLNNLRYADDTTLMAGTDAELKDLSIAVKDSSKKYGLTLNMKKTKVMTTAKDTNTFELAGEDIEVVDSFTFLGSNIERGGDCKEEISRRIILGRTAMAALDKIWKDKNIKTLTKCRLVKALVFPVALYGSETWTPRKAEDKRLDAFEQWCWRRMLRIPWTAKRTNESVRHQVNATTTLATTVLKQKLTYFGHVVRAEGLESSVMLGMGEGKRERGRPRTRWLDAVKSTTGLTLLELVAKVRVRATGGRWSRRSIMT